jgi:hypothetical protein
MKNKEILEIISDNLTTLNELINNGYTKDLNYIMSKLLNLVKFINQNRE